MSEMVLGTNSIATMTAGMNTLVIVDEPEEVTTIYAWKENGFKKLPYDEHIAKSGQHIKTFMTPNKSERVTVVTAKRDELCITLQVGIIESNTLKPVGEPIKYYGSRNIAKVSEKYMHRATMENPIMFFSLDPNTFGEEIKGQIVENTELEMRARREIIRPIDSSGVVGIAHDRDEKPNFYSQRIRVAE